MVHGPEVGLGFAGGLPAFYQRLAQGLAGPDWPGLARALVLPGTKSGPGYEVGGRRKSLHTETYCDDNGFNGTAPHPGNGLQPGEGVVTMCETRYGIRFAGRQDGKNPLTPNAQNIREDTAELHIGPFEHLLGPVDFHGPRLDDTLAIADQFPQLALRAGM